MELREHLRNYALCNLHILFIDNMQSRKLLLELSNAILIMMVITMNKT